MSRYRTVKRWQKALDAESYRADTAEHARQMAEMQLSLLQAQIEPHFLYNTLASVQYLIRKDHESADFMLTQLIRYLRHAMPKMRSSLSTLGQEFELADAYLQIARIRMGGRLTVDMALPEPLESHEFPPLIIQTLVENALKHGLEPKTGPVSISVNASMVDSKLSVTVSDTGVGLGSTITPGSGTGLANIRNRLNVIYPGRSHLSINAASDGGVVAQVTIDEVESGETK
jgi:LytS/YehU family sensor histidine kinase